MKKYNIEFCEKLCLGEDMNFNFKVFFNISKLKVLQEGLYNYYHSGVGATNSLEKQKEIFETFDEIISSLSKNKNFEKMKKIFDKK